MDENKLDVIMAFAQIAASAAIGAYGLMVSKMTQGKQFTENWEVLKTLVEGHNELTKIMIEMRGK